MNYYHYTYIHKFERILADGMIKPTDVGIEANEKPCVWFSQKNKWEPTSKKIIRLKDGSMETLDTLR